MANLQISGLPPILGSDVTTNCVLAIDDATAVTYNINLLQLLAYILSFINLPATPNVVTTNTEALIGNNSYLVDYTGGSPPVVLTLPTTIQEGDQIQIIGYQGAWQVAQNAGQQILSGAKQTTSGTGGSISSSNVTDCVNLVCVVANTKFIVNQPQGNINVT